MTLHRPSNVDHPDTLREICRGLEAIAETLHLVFPCHPRTEERVKSFGLSALFGGSVLKGKGIALISPLGYLDFLQLHANAKIMLTDSGGIQEEATILGVPCLTLRENTERPITITQGTNRLVGTRREAILEGFQTALHVKDSAAQQPEKWDGKAAERIVGVLAEITKKGETGTAHAVQQLPPESGPSRVGYEKVTLNDLMR